MRRVILYGAVVGVLAVGTVICVRLSGHSPARPASALVEAPGSRLAQTIGIPGSSDRSPPAPTGAGDADLQQTKAAGTGAAGTGAPAPAGDWDPHVRELLDAATFKTPAYTALTNLSAEEAERALAVLSRERQMQASFRGLSAEVVLALQQANGAEEPQSVVRGILKIGIEPSDPAQNTRLPWKYKIELSDSSKTWSVVSDGTPAGTTVAGKDKETEAHLRSLLQEGQLLQALTLPRDLLLSLWADPLYPRGRITRERFFSLYTPWRNPGAGVEPDSYIFQNALTKSNVMAFQGGHLSEWDFKKANGDVARISYRQYVEDKGVFFPAQILIDPGRDGPRYAVRLAGVALTPADPAGERR